jgi:GNAT superfamily N-acetyltransferase
VRHEGNGTAPGTPGEERVRDATPADLDTLVAFNRAMARETEGRDLDADLLRTGTDAVLRDPARGRYLVVEDGDGAPLGQLLITTEWSDWRNGWFWWIQSVYVRPEARGRGVYRRLHREVERLARDRGNVVGLRLYVATENRAAQAVYAAVGMSAADYRMFETDWVLH